MSDYFQAKRQPLRFELRPRKAFLNASLCCLGRLATGLSFASAFSDYFLSDFGVVFCGPLYSPIQGARPAGFLFPMSDFLRTTLSGGLPVFNTLAASGGGATVTKGFVSFLLYGVSGPFIDHC
jgi:hypothetical protein